MPYRCCFISGIVPYPIEYGIESTGRLSVYMQLKHHYVNASTHLSLDSFNFDMPTKVSTDLNADSQRLPTLLVEHYNLNPPTHPSKACHGLSAAEAHHHSLARYARVAIALVSARGLRLRLRGRLRRPSGLLLSLQQLYRLRASKMLLFQKLTTFAGS